MAKWEQIRNEHGPAVWGVVYRILAHYEDARDCLQDVFIEAIHSSSAPHVRNWRGYLCWLGTRRAIDRLRSRRRERGEPIDIDSPTPHKGDLTEQSETIAIIRAELARLPESQATAFWLAHVEQLTYVEIAEQLQSTPNAVGILIHRAKLHLKQKLSHLVEEQRHGK